MNLPVSDDKIGTLGATDKIALTGNDSGTMLAIAENARNERADLRLIHDSSRQSILIAGGDEQARSELMDELAQRLPEGTSFEQADAMWELVERAPSSRVVMLAGELDDGSTESMMSLLRSRHPRLPVIALGERA